MCFIFVKNVGVNIVSILKLLNRTNRTKLDNQNYGKIK